MLPIVWIRRVASPRAWAFISWLQLASVPPRFHPQPCPNASLARRPETALSPVRTASPPSAAATSLLHCSAPAWWPPSKGTTLCPLASSTRTAGSLSLSVRSGAIKRVTAPVAPITINTPPSCQWCWSNTAAEFTRHVPSRSGMAAAAPGVSAS